MPAVGRASLAAALVAMLAIAGCNAPGGGPATRTLTPAAVPTDTPTPTPTELAPGLTRRGVTDPSRLAAAHAAALRNTSYTYRVREVVRADDGSELFRRTVVARVAADGAFDHTRRLRGGISSGYPPGPEPDVRSYSNGTVTVLCYRARNATDCSGYRAARAPVTNASFLDAALLTAAFRATNARVVGATAQNGTTLYAVRATGGTLDLRYVVATNLTLTARIDPAGVVHELDITYESPGGGLSGRITLTYAAIGGTAVERPPWVDEAAANTSYDWPLELGPGLRSVSRPEPRRPPGVRGRASARPTAVASR